MRTMEIRSILVATDLGEGSDEVVREAARLAAASGAALHLLHAVDLRPAPYLADEAGGIVLAETMREAEAGIEGQARRVVPEGVAVASRRVVAHVAYRAVRDAADEVGADLVVLGPHRRWPVIDGLLGSTADRVIRTLGVPVLVLRGPLTLPMRRMVVPLDLSELARGALDLALGWSGAFGRATDPTGLPGREVRVLHVIPRLFEMEDFPFDRAVVGPELGREVAEALRRVEPAEALDVRQELLWGDDPAGEITRYAEREGADVLVMGTHGYGAIRRALLGGVTSRVARTASCPVLLVPPALWRPGASRRAVTRGAAAGG